MKLIKNNKKKNYVKKNSILTSIIRFYLNKKSVNKVLKLKEVWGFYSIKKSKLIRSENKKRRRMIQSIPEISSPGFILCKKYNERQDESSLKIYDKKIIGRIIKELRRFSSYSDNNSILKYLISACEEEPISNNLMSAISDFLKKRRKCNHCGTEYKLSENVGVYYCKRSFGIPGYFKSIRSMHSDGVTDCGTIKIPLLFFILFVDTPPLESVKFIQLKITNITNRVHVFNSFAKIFVAAK